MKWSKYIPHKPTSKQMAFLSLPHLEAFYGGAAGGGKSDALLMGALQYVDQSDYSAIIFRRTYADMKLPSSILSRTKEWLAPFLATKEIIYRPSDNHTFTFPSGAKLAFGYMGTEGIEVRYQSSEYSGIFYDELTHFHEHEYLYLFSRLRRQVGSNIPLRMRSASNPGDRGMRWVRDRFQIEKDKETGKYVGHNPDAPFIPASILDNPFINPEYLETLEKLPKIQRERLKYGNWEIAEDAIFNAAWFTDRWIKKGPYYSCQTIEGCKVYHEDSILKFATVDCASSVKTGVNKQTYYRDRLPSWSVIATWGLTPKGELLWLDNIRLQDNIPTIVDRIYKNHKINKPLFTRIEANGPGQGVYQLAERKGLPIRPIHTLYDKIVNSTSAQLRAEANQIWLPKFAPWVKALEDELYTWSGHPDEIDDQIDVMSSAANEASERAVGIEKDFDFRNSVHATRPIDTGGLFSTAAWRRPQVASNVF